MPCGREKPCFDKAWRQGEQHKGPEVSADAFRAATSVQACALYPPAAGRPMFPLRGHIGVVGRDFQMVTPCLRPKLRETFVCSGMTVSRSPGGPSLAAGQPVSQRSGERDQPSGGRAARKEQAEFTSAVSDARAYKPRVRTACPGLTGGGVTREKENVARPVGMSRRNSLPPLSEMTTVQVKGQYSVSGADGRGWYSGIGKCRADDRQ